MLNISVFKPLYRESGGSMSYPGYNGGGASTGTSYAGNSGSGGDGDYFGMIFGGGAMAAAPPVALCSTSFILPLVIILIWHTTTVLHLLWSFPLLLAL